MHCIALHCKANAIIVLFSGHHPFLTALPCTKYLFKPHIFCPKHRSASYIEIQDQVKKWRPNSWNVTHSYRWLFSNKFFIFAFFVEISTATPHQHPCRTFVLVFGMTLEIKNLRKTIFEFYQFPVKIILVGLCLKALNSIEKLHHPS